MTTSSETSTAAPAWGWAGLAVSGVCLALGGISALETRHMSVTHGFPIHWHDVLQGTTPRWILLAITLPFVLRFATRTPLRPLTVKAVASHTIIFLLLGLAHAVVTAWSQAVNSDIALLFPWTARLLRATYGSAPITVSLYAAVLGAAWAITEAREREERTVRTSQLEAQLQAARLAALRARLQPHFLYNTLNAIAALAGGSDPRRAVAAIEELGELLHASLRDDARQVIPLPEEFALAERYLSLQRMRFGERLRYELSVDPAVADAAVPVLLLQPLVENAVTHGLEDGQERLRVTVTARAIEGGVELLVENDGPEFAGGGPPSGHGVGLAATRARLHTTWGDDASLELLSRDGGGVVVRVRIPRIAAQPASTPAVAAT